MRVFKVPEHAQFTHKPHVQAGVQCQTCHGRIEAMERVHAETGQSIVNDLMNLARHARPAAQADDGLVRGVPPRRQRERRAAGQTVADAPIPSVLRSPGSESARRNAPLECVTCHH